MNPILSLVCGVLLGQPPVPVAPPSPPMVRVQVQPEAMTQKLKAMAAKIEEQEIIIAKLKTALAAAQKPGAKVMVFDQAKPMTWLGGLPMMKGPDGKEMRFEIRIQKEDDKKPEVKKPEGDKKPEVKRDNPPMGRGGFGGFGPGGPPMGREAFGRGGPPEGMGRGGFGGGRGGMMGMGPDFTPPGFDRLSKEEQETFRKLMTKMMAPPERDRPAGNPRTEGREGRGRPTEQPRREGGDRPSPEARERAEREERKPSMEERMERLERMIEELMRKR